VGWRVSRSAHAGFVLDALEQALHDRKPVSDGRLVHHSDRGVQYVSIKYTERLAEAGLVPSVGSVGDSYDNALAETINGLYKAELRRTAASGMAALGFQQHIIERVLNHVSGAQGGLVGVYQRYEYLEDRKRALHAWGNHVETLVTEKPSVKNVVQLRA
jgi:transposase InsO family protein